MKLDHDPKIDDMANETSKDRWYEEIDDLSDPPDAGEIDERNSDSSDYEETYVKRRKKKKVMTTLNKILILSALKSRHFHSSRLLSFYHMRLN